jgi:hypothetical protein
MAFFFSAAFFNAIFFFSTIFFFNAIFFFSTIFFVVAAFFAAAFFAAALFAGFFADRFAVLPAAFFFAGLREGFFASFLPAAFFFRAIFFFKAFFFFTAAPERFAAVRFAPARRFTRDAADLARDDFPDDALRRVLDLRLVAMDQSSISTGDSVGINPVVRACGPLPSPDG